MKQWKEIERGLGLSIPDLDTKLATLEGLEAAFRPLVKTIPHDADPAIFFHAAEKSSGESL